MTTPMKAPENLAAALALLKREQDRMRKAQRDIERLQKAIADGPQRVAQATAWVHHFSAPSVQQAGHGAEDAA